MRRTPITDKKTTRVTYGDVTSVVCHMQGWRKSMEDNSSMVQLPSGILMYIVCDGHGGEEVAIFACKYLPMVFNNLEQNFTDDEIKMLSDEYGFNVIPVNFYDAYKFGGAFHCQTLDIHRDGHKKSYFPYFVHLEETRGGCLDIYRNSGCIQCDDKEQENEIKIKI